MVDFQARDTRRGPTTDDADDESTGSDTAGADDGGAEPGGESGEAESSTSEDGETRTDITEVEETDEETPTDITEVEETDEETPTDITEVEEMASEESPADVTGPESASGEPPTDGTAAEEPDGGDSGAGEAPSERTAADDQPAASKAVPGDSAPTTGRTVDVAVVTVGTEAFEPLEDAVTTAFESAGHRVVTRERLRGGYDAIQQMVESLVDRADVDVVVTVGGVGIAPDDLAIEAVHPLLEKALPGFGETFRSLLFERVGTGITGVRSTAGVAEGTLVFCLPGDAEAAGLAVEEILATEAPELVGQLD